MADVGFTPRRCVFQACALGCDSVLALAVTALGSGTSWALSISSVSLLPPLPSAHYLTPVTPLQFTLSCSLTVPLSFCQCHPAKPPPCLSGAFCFLRVYSQTAKPHGWKENHQPARLWHHSGRQGSGETSPRQSVLICPPHCDRTSSWMCPCPSCPKTKPDPPSTPYLSPLNTLFPSSKRCLHSLPVYTLPPQHSFHSSLVSVPSRCSLVAEISRRGSLAKLWSALSPPLSTALALRNPPFWKHSLPLGNRLLKLHVLPPSPEDSQPETRAHPHSS